VINLSRVAMLDIDWSTHYYIRNILYFIYTFGMVFFASQIFEIIKYAEIYIDCQQLICNVIV
jgi:hypothetical protein